MSTSGQTLLLSASDLLIQEMLLTEGSKRAIGPSPLRPEIISSGGSSVKWWGRQELADDPRFLTQSLRAKNQQALFDILQPIFLTRTAEEWCRLLDEKGVPCAPVNTYPEILGDEHIRHMGLVRKITLPNGATTRTVGFPVEMTGYDFRIDRPPPKLGGHNEEVFAEWMAKELIRS